MWRPALFLGRCRPLHRWSRLSCLGYSNDQGARFGPFPAGIPVNILANIDLLGDHGSGWERTKRDAEVLKLLLGYQHEVGHLQNPTDGRLEAASQKSSRN